MNSYHKIKSTCLLPYCPLPIDSGARAVFRKHLNILNDLGECTVLSTARRPVGFGWSPEALDELGSEGIAVQFGSKGLQTRFLGVYGILYAALFKMLRAEKAFGHSNPYHRYAFDPEWVNNITKDKGLCEIHYSYWARLPVQCPKIVVVHDLWSDIMWEGDKRETEELKQADLIVTVSKSDHDKLIERGVTNVLWSPPVVEQEECEDSEDVMIVGSDNRHNREGLNWLIGSEKHLSPISLRIYGSLASRLKPAGALELYPRYASAVAPYKKNGIVLMTTSHGTGIQIKAIEALACGRAIIARRGAMRGMPDGDGAWLEVDEPEEMVEAAKLLVRDPNRRIDLMNRSSYYYKEHFDSNRILKTLSDRYKELQ